MCIHNYNRYYKSDRWTDGVLWRHIDREFDLVTEGQRGHPWGADGWAGIKGWRVCCGKWESREQCKHKEEPVTRSVAGRRVSLTAHEDAPRCEGKEAVRYHPRKGGVWLISVSKANRVGLFFFLKEAEPWSSAARVRGGKESDQPCILRTFLFYHVGKTLQWGRNGTWELLLETVSTG